jgi:hypothetical protein
LRAHDRQPSAAPTPDTIDRRCHPRLKFETKITVNSRSCGLLEGYTIDISESGVSAILMIEVPVGEVVELEFTLPHGPVRIYAMVRQRSAFRYGFQFVHSEAIAEVIRPTCHELAMRQSLPGGV